MKPNALRLDESNIGCMTDSIIFLNKINKPKHKKIIANISFIPQLPHLDIVDLIIATISRGLSKGTW